MRHRLSLVKDIVAVPDTRTYIVAVGDVHKTKGAVTRSFERDQIFWAATTPRQKPAFFEEGKTYRHSDENVTFRVDRVKLGNDMVAFGLFIRGINTQWWGIRTGFDGWEEA
ncbi:hypothetical protein [Streptomyces tanashiensis]|uniref:hypothetical protein n=1 Tax=Streptomyces tanashiensis TaxID=67367 RepID=UPI00343196F1